MIGFNGGLIGAYRDTNYVSSAPGVWSPNEQVVAKRQILWVGDSAQQLTLKGEGVNNGTVITDSSPYGRTLNVNGSVSTRTAVFKYGSSSIFFDGSGDWLSIGSPPASLVQWWTADFTIQCWVYLLAAPTNGGNGQPNVCGWASSISTNEAWSFGPLNNRTVRFYYFTTAQQSVTTTATLALNQWYHLAFTRSGTTLRIFIDGVQTASATQAAGTPTSATGFPFMMGRTTSTGGFNGYIDDFQILYGVALYTANFTPPGPL